MLIRICFSNVEKCYPLRVTMEDILAFPDKPQIVGVDNFNPN
jgi:hypothetical protein